MARKPASWKMTALFFAWTAFIAIGGTVASNSVWRRQFLSFHSDFWQIVIPSDLVAVAALAIAARFIVNWAWTKRRCAISETHQS